MGRSSSRTALSRSTVSGDVVKVKVKVKVKVMVMVALVVVALVVVGTC